mgnify:CR=1 FL=1
MKDDDRPMSFRAEWLTVEDLSTYMAAFGHISRFTQEMIRAGAPPRDMFAALQFQALAIIDAASLGDQAACNLFQELADYYRERGFDRAGH